VATRQTSTTLVSPTTAKTPSFNTNSKTATSDESKQHSKEVLEQEFNGGNVEKDSGNKNPSNVAGGLKA